MYMLLKKILLLDAEIRAKKTSSVYDCTVEDVE